MRKQNWRSRGRNNPAPRVLGVLGSLADGASSSHLLRVRLPRRIIAPFLLFWCVGSLVLGHELARLPLATLASSVMRPAQSIVQAQGALSHSEPRIAPPQMAAGLIGAKLPAPVHHSSAKHRGRAKTTSHALRPRSRDARALDASFDSQDHAPPDAGWYDGWGGWQDAPGFQASWYGYRAAAAASDAMALRAHAAWMAARFGGGCFGAPCG